MKTITITITDSDHQLDLLRQLAWMIQESIVELSVGLALQKYQNQEEKSMWQGWLAARELIRQQVLTQSLQLGQTHIKDLIGDDVLQDMIQDKVVPKAPAEPRVMGDYTDPTGFARPEQLIYLNPFNGLFDRLRALRDHDRNVGCFSEALAYNAEYLEDVMKDTQAELGDDMPTFRSATYIKQ